MYKESNQKFQGHLLKSVPPTPLAATLENLEKFTCYTIRVFAFTNNGNGVSSEPVTLETQEDGKLSLISTPVFASCYGFNCDVQLAGKNTPLLCTERLNELNEMNATNQRLSVSVVLLVIRIS